MSEFVFRNVRIHATDVDATFAGQVRAGVFPAGEIRRVPVACRATIGSVGNADHMNIELGKAGRKRWMGRRPHVRGTAMNPIDHPHGGGSHQHVGRPSTVGYDAPPGKKVGRLSPKPKRIRERKQRR